MTKNLLAAAVAMSFVGTSQADNTLGFDDFDTSVAGTDYQTRVFTPDNSANPGQGGAPGAFPSSNFDLFGITNRDFNFDWADDTQNGFAGDVLGFAGVGANDPGNFVGVSDTVNGDNSSPVTAQWTFDISGAANVNVGVDLAAYGDFETSDLYIFQASIDGGTPAIIFDGGMSAAQDDADNLYSLQMDSGTQPDRAPQAFFNANENQFLIDNSAAIQATADPFVPELTFDPDGIPANGDEVLISFHPDDDGTTNGDTTALDGFIPITGAAGTFEEAAYFVTNDFGTFEEPASVPFRDPIFEQISGTQLSNELQSFVAELAGTGDTLTLTFTASANGGGEQFAFDNLIVFEAIEGFIDGDYNGDGFVSQADLDLVLLNWGDATVPAEWLALDQFDGTQVSQNELDGVLLNWGNGTPPSANAIPEPASLVLLGLGGLALTTRRRA